MESALEAAIAWRNHTEKELGKLRTDKHHVTVARSNTGVLGIEFNEKLNRYDVRWTDSKGTARNISFHQKAWKRSSFYQSLRHANGEKYGTVGRLMIAMRNKPTL